MKNIFIILIMIIASFATDIQPIIQIDGLGISTLEKDLEKPIFILGYSETGLKVTKDKVTFTSSLNINDDFSISVKDVKIEYKNVNELSIYVGHTEEPFGSYKTNAVSYSFLRGLEREHNLMFGLTGVLVNKSLKFNIAAISNDSTTLNSAAVYIDYKTKYITSDVSVKSNLDTTKVAFGLTTQFNPLWDLSVKGYTNVNSKENAGFTELSFYPTHRLITSLRYDVIGDEVSGKSNGSLSCLVILNENTTLGLEYAILNDIYNNKATNTVNQVSLLASFLW